jgi:putative acetyltransferase
MTAYWYEIRVSETLDCQWSQWFAGMEVVPLSEGSHVAGTLLRGNLPDQAALFGILSQLRNLNLTLIEVKRVNHLMPVIRPETPADVDAIYTVNKQAFDGREGEPRLVDAIRKSNDFIPELSLVAVENDHVIGHILFSRIYIQSENEQLPALALAPMAILPEYQKQGIGSALVRHGLEECKRLGYTLIIVLGNPAYYARFGFAPELAKSLECPFGDCGDAWMALELISGALKGVRGKVIYPSAFDNV